MKEGLTDSGKTTYNKGKPIRCGCGCVIAYKKNDILMLYCKKCKRQIPYIVRARA